MSCITDLTVTFGSTIAESGFHRVVDPAHIGADINRGEGRSCFLWYRRGPVTKDAVQEILVRMTFPP